MVSLTRRLGLANAPAPRDVGPLIFIVGKPPLPLSLRDALDTELRRDALGAGNGRLRGVRRRAVAEAGIH